MSIVVFCGSFDPVHEGHVALARYVAALPYVKKVLMLVTPQNPLKPASTSASLEQRLDMVKIALADSPAIEASDFERTLPPPLFTYNTLRALQQLYPGEKIRLLIGSDNWLLFDKWRASQQIISEFGLLIYPRPGYDIDSASLPDNVIYLPQAPMLGISSSEIRAGKNHLIPPGVYNYIINHNLYGR